VLELWGGKRRLFLTGSDEGDRGLANVAELNKPSVFCKVINEREYKQRSFKGRRRNTPFSERSWGGVRVGEACRGGGLPLDAGAEKETAGGEYNGLRGP